MSKVTLNTAKELELMDTAAAKIKAVLPHLSPKEIREKYGKKFEKYVSGGTEMPYEIEVALWHPGEGEGVHNELELQSYTSNDVGFLARGTVGELWVIEDKANNYAKYSLLDGTPLTKEALTDDFITVARNETFTYLVQATESIVVCDGWGKEYYCPAGAYIACGVNKETGEPDLGYFWVIAEKVVDTTNKKCVVK